jgi:hypothetical protein
MTLYIGFVDSTVSIESITVAFNDTFDADVYVKFSDIKTSYGIEYKTATIYNSTISNEMSQFISEIKKHGTKCFNCKLNTWTVQLEKPICSIVVTVPETI